MGYFGGMSDIFGVSGSFSFSDVAKDKDTIIRFRLEFVLEQGQSDPGSGGADSILTVRVKDVRR